MATFYLPYGHRRVTFSVPETVHAITIDAERMPSSKTVSLKEILERPIGLPRLSEIARPGQRVVIITSDITRPCPTACLLPPVLEELAMTGVCDSDISVVFGLGAHRKHTNEERERLIGPEMLDRVRCLDSDPLDVIDMGKTSRGTPVEFFRPVVEADLRICLGVVEFHYFAGYSGGAKAIFPGVASRRTITANHAMMNWHGAVGGQINGNPVRQDIEEGAALLGTTYNLNVVVDSDKHIVAAFSGDLTASHREACATVDACSKIHLDLPADIVIVSAGGFPKDINLYQAHKALENAALAIRDGGTIILVAECQEGIGNATLAEWLAGATSPDAILERINKEFNLGGHKAAAIARLQKRVEIGIASEIPDDLARDCSFRPFSSPQAAIDSAFRRIGDMAHTTLVVMPHGGSVLPSIS